MRVEDLRALRLFDGVTDERLAALIEAGREVPIVPGVVLFQEGEAADYWYVVVSGELTLTRHIGREEVVVGQMTPGRWSGGFRAWDEHGVCLATGRGVAAGRVLEVPAKELRRLTDQWFPLGGHIIGGLLGTARFIETTVRQRDSLVTLGTLAADLAHELNNPAAAASRAVTALDEACHSLLDGLTTLAHEEITAGQFAALDALRREIEPPAAARDPLTLADEEDVLSAWLARHGVVRDDLIAPPLVAAGVDVAWCQRAAEVLGEQALEPGLAWVANAVSAVMLLVEVKESTRRISELVASVRSYTQMDRASMQLVDVTDGIESTLVMLGNKLRDGITVVRDFDAGVPRIEAYPGELNQVWTNLIDNAVYAMSGAGTLRLSTRVDGDHVVVERHGGTITIDPRPGETVLRVTVPVSRASA